MIKTFFNKVQDLIMQRFFLSYFLLIAVYILFHKAIEVFISKVFVDGILSLVETTLYNDLICLFVLVYLIVILVSKHQRTTHSKRTLTILFFFSVIYGYYRFVGGPWKFVSSKFFPSVKYLDFIILVSLCFIILLIGKTKKSKPRTNSPFFDDESIGKTNKDELGFLPYATDLAKKIQESAFENAFAIGVNGKWGTGKTSFLDLLKRQLTGTDILLIDFSPWNSNNIQSLVQGFFENIQEKIHPNYSTLSRLLTSYSNKLSAVSGNTFGKTVQASISAIIGFDSLSSLHKEINNALKKLDKKLIVVIDDMDRLNKEEVLEVIRLIRNTANFYNTFFIVAYDRNYILDAIKEHNNHNHEQFLEKIFQIEITLPYFDKSVLRNRLVENLTSKFPNSQHATIKKVILGDSSNPSANITNWLDSMRDVTRISNALVLNLGSLFGEVEFSDFLRLELLRIKYPSVYELLFKKTSEFLETKSSGDGFDQYQLKKLGDNLKKGNDKEKHKNIEYHIQYFLAENFDELSIPKQDVQKISTFLEDIFGQGYSFYLYSRNHLSVIYPSKFHRYFAYSLLKGNLSEIEFSRARSSTPEEFNSHILKWVNEGSYTAVAERLELIKHFDNRQDFEKIIRAIFFYANIQTGDSDPLFGNLLGYNGKDIISKMDNHENKLASKYFSNDIKSLKSFTNDLFDSASTPFTFESRLIRDIAYDFSEDFPLNKKEVIDIGIDYLQKFASGIDKFNSSIWRLYHCTKYKLFIPSENGNYSSNEIVPEKSREIVKRFILEKDFDGFLMAVIEQEPFDQVGFSISKIVPEIFGSWDEFKTQLQQISDDRWKFVEEFKRFFLECELKNFGHYVKFDFKLIPIKERFKNQD